jgi:hypothetical protein
MIDSPIHVSFHALSDTFKLLEFLEARGQAIEKGANPQTIQSYPDDRAMYTLEQLMTWRPSGPLALPAPAPGALAPAPLAPAAVAPAASACSPGRH